MLIQDSHYYGFYQHNDMYPGGSSSLVVSKKLLRFRQMMNGVRYSWRGS